MESWCNARLNTLRPGVLWPPTCVQPATGQFHASRKSFWKRKFSKIGALLPFGKWKFDPVKSTIRTLNQHDLSLPWGNFGSNCVKVLLAEAILELFEYNPGGEQAALWKYWSNSHPERGATTAERHTMGKEKRSVRIRIQRWSFFFLSFFFFLTWFLLSFFFLFFWRTGFTHYSWSRLLVSQQSFVMEMRRDIICFLQPAIKYMERERRFICM